MRLFLASTTTIALAACSPATGDSNDASEVEVATEKAPDYYVMGPGVYDIEGGEGVVYATSELREDGTYVDSAGETEVGHGTWVLEGEKICFDPEGDGEDQLVRCWTNSALTDDGTFVTTRDDGSQSYTVRPRRTD